ncbi:Nn.00g014470.m01.CDS01 [Neocucurbitaria sp. VM-36]
MDFRKYNPFAFHSMEEITSLVAALDCVSETPISESETKSPLLCLPGEIRNLIYAFVAEEESQKIAYQWHPRSYVFLDKTKWLDIISKPRDDDWFHDCSRQDWGLTQVCRSIRSEYLPIHKAHTTYEVRHTSIASYTKTVLLSGGSVKEKDATGRLIIDLNGRRRDTGYDFVAPRRDRVDIVPLIQLCSTANPNQRLLFVSIQNDSQKEDAQDLE